MSWYSISNNRVCLDHPTGFKIIKPENDDNVVPFLCPVCDLPMLSPYDPREFKKNGCCEPCSLRWVDLNRQKWTMGWRPTESQIKQEVARRLARTKDIRIE